MEEKFMKLAIKEANKAAFNGDVPVGAVIVLNGKVIAKAFNKKDLLNNCLAHAEIIAINKASKKLKNYRLLNCEMYVTFEPCLMCAGAILSARIKQVYFGAYDNRYGSQDLFENSKFNHSCKYLGGLMEKECSNLLTDFFKDLRNNNKQ